MALSIVGSFNTGGFGVTSLTPALPGGVAVDDLILVAASTSNAATLDVDYTALTGSPVAQSNNFSAAGRKLAVSSEPDPTMSQSSSDRMAAGGIVISGVNTTTPIAAQDSAVESGFVTSITAPTVAAGGATVYSVLILTTENTSGTITWPAGWTQQFLENVSGFGPTLAVAVNTSPGTGSVAPGSISFANARQSSVWHVLAQEAGGGGPSTVLSPVLGRYTPFTTNYAGRL